MTVELLSSFSYSQGRMTTTARKTLGKRIRELRKKKGYSQEQLADRADLHRTYIGSIERGEQNVSIDNITKVSKALEVKIVDLFLSDR